MAFCGSNFLVEVFWHLHVGSNNFLMYGGQGWLCGNKGTTLKVAVLETVGQVLA
ncbi:hypothetical protein CIPAW_04G103900 [Carya illinoinensis]|uniref:Uncharacterized protein n=1 Tax=Carya illinoinensis TaxID=32201 RepID=A0A8T1QU30_CARIL|nr:hypothetical protein CIPAW_04G103900 [Carya illinoinensis]